MHVLLQDLDEAGLVGLILESSRRLFSLVESLFPSESLDYFTREDVNSPV